MRWFSPWTKLRTVQDFNLPLNLISITGQKTVPIGDAILKTPSCLFGTELCEELFTPLSPHTKLSLQGVEVFTNPSASHHEFEKLGRRIGLIREASLKCGGVYLYANQQGKCDMGLCD
jgi:NAD+ synthase (glutamine-hydrolysing)